MKIRMRQQMSGTRSLGQQWPPAGDTLVVSDHEGALLCSAGIADPVAEDPPIEIRSEGKATAAASAAAAATTSPPPSPAKPRGGKA